MPGTVPNPFYLDVLETAPDMSQPSWIERGAYAADRNSRGGRRPRRRDIVSSYRAELALTGELSDRYGAFRRGYLDRLAEFGLVDELFYT